MVTELFSKCAVVGSIPMEGAGFALLFVLFIGLVCFSIVWHHSRSREVLEQWANRSGYKLVSSEYRNFNKGPFFWTSSKGQAVFYVTVQDQQGKIRSGFVRCGNWLGGLLSDEATVKWNS